MKFLVTRPFPDAKVLVLLASLCFLPGCGKTEAVSNKADSNSNKSETESGKSDAPIGDTDALVGLKDVNDKAAKPASAATPATPPAKGPTYASREVYGDEAVADEVVAMERRNAALAARRFSFVQRMEPAPLQLEAAGLIHEAAEKMGSSALTDESEFEGSRYQEAAQLAGRGILILKRQGEPSDPAAQTAYRTTLLEGLSVRAEALGALATSGDPSQGRVAETAYREYLAAESNTGRKTRAEYKFASMLVALGELDKARTTYEGLLARNGQDKEALAGLVLVHQKIAVDQKAAGKEAAATVNTELSASYAERLNKLPSEPSITTSDESSADKAIREYMRTEGKDKAAERLEAPRLQYMRVPDKASPARPKVEEVERQRARRRPGE